MIQDFRGQGPPADTGTFVMPVTVMAYKVTFAGTTYAVSVRMGARGWVLLSYLPDTPANVSTVLQAGINEVGLIGGDFWLGSYMWVLSVTLNLDNSQGLFIRGTNMFQCSLWLAAGSNTNILSCTPTVNRYFPFAIEWLRIFGNRANNLIAGTGVFCSNVDGGAPNDVHLSHVLIDQCREYCFWSNVFWGYHITDCLFEYGTLGGAYITGVLGAFVHCRFSGCDGPSLHMGSTFGRVIACEFQYNDTDGVVLAGARGIFADNHVIDNLDIGVLVTGADCIICSNLFQHNSTAVPGNESDLEVRAARTLVMLNNFVGANTSDYGVDLQAGGDRCVVQHNRFQTHVTAPIRDWGYKNIFETLTLPFIDGTASVTADGAPKGWRVAAANEFAIAYGVMPINTQQTFRISVWAVGLAAPGVGNQMLINLTANGAQPDEVYTGEAITVNSKESNETNFAINDIVTWTFTAADDLDIRDLVAGDCLEIKLIYRAAVAPDIATNALLRCVEIEYA